MTDSAHHSGGGDDLDLGGVRLNGSTAFGAVIANGQTCSLPQGSFRDRASFQNTKRPGLPLLLLAAIRSTTRGWSSTAFAEKRSKEYKRMSMTT